MRALPATTAIAFTICMVAGSGCHRNLEPYVPGETASQPDLRKIFPPGAALAERPAGQASGEPGLPPPPAEETAPAATSGPPVRGRVELAPGAASPAAGQAILFVIARRGSGPPIAVKRIQAPVFPLDFEIGADDRMIATVAFAGPLELAARLDGDGNASTRSPGDLQGVASATVEPGAEGVTIVLGEAP
jgi:cytochrome c-type biogenesis protein CcmH